MATEEKIKPEAEEKEQPKLAEAKPEVKEEKKEGKKVEQKKIAKKEEAVARGDNLHASMKQCMYICAFIKNKHIDDAIKDLEQVIKMKKVVPFKGEIPHRSAPGIMSGRYPVNASKLFIPILKGLKGNVIANQMDLDKSRITFASACWASRPSKRGGGRFKRTNVVLKARESNTTEVPTKVASKTS
jgi:ribosomal protein L22